MMNRIVPAYLYGNPAALCPQLSGSMAFVREAVGSGNGSFNVVLSVAPANGNALRLAIVTLSTVLTVTGGGVGTWTRDLTQVGADGTGTGVLEIWSGQTDGSSATVTITISGRGLSGAANLSEFSGPANAAAQSTNSNSSLGNATVTTNSVTPLSATSLVFAAAGWALNDYSSGPTNSFIRLTPANGSGIFLETSYQIESAIASYSTGYTLIAGIGWAAGIAAYG